MALWSATDALSGNLAGLAQVHSSLSKWRVLTSPSSQVSHPPPSQERRPHKEAAHRNYQSVRRGYQSIDRKQ